MVARKVLRVPELWFTAPKVDTLFGLSSVEWPQPAAPRDARQALPELAAAVQELSTQGRNFNSSGRQRSCR